MDRTRSTVGRWAPRGSASGPSELADFQRAFARARRDFRLHDADGMRRCLLVLVASCVGDAPGADPYDDIAAATPGGLDRHRLIEDSDLAGDQDVTVAQIQKLLENEGSALATFSEDGRSAARWIVEESRAARISPVYMIARIETESSLIRSGTLDKIRQATGCACPDGSACDPSFAAFGLQVRCAAELVRGYLTDLEVDNSTVTGWGVGVGKSSSDPCWVVPQNRATAALYTYTPWVGHYARQCGTSQWGGSSLVALLLRHFKGRLPPPAGGSCPLGNGLYCGDNGIPGDPGTLYRCTDGAITAVEACAAGCFAKPSGEADACVDTTQSCSAGNGLYCGGNGIAGNADTLYRCHDGTVSVETVCPVDCVPQPTGINDTCN